MERQGNARGTAAYTEMSWKIEKVIGSHEILQRNRKWRWQGDSRCFCAKTMMEP